MKKIALTIQLCALLFTVYGQEQAFSISGDIELDKGQLLVLTQRPGKTDTLARTAIVGRKFDIRGTLDEAVVAHLVIEGYVGGFIMMLEPGEEYTATLTRDGVGDIHGGKPGGLQRISADCGRCQYRKPHPAEESGRGGSQKAFQDYQGAGGQSRQGTRERFREDECSDTQECG